MPSRMLVCRLKLVVRYSTLWDTDGVFWTDVQGTVLYERWYNREQPLPIPGVLGWHTRSRRVFVAING